MRVERANQEGPKTQGGDLPPFAIRRSPRSLTVIWLAGIFLLALALRLLVWRWHAQDPLGGDEQEYFDQALTLLRTHHYVELKLMRPPLYTGFLAGCIYLFDSLVQRLRLVQAIISALTVVPLYLLTRQMFGERRTALLAALLAALSYTLAANATELLTETLFVFGLSFFFWLVLVASHSDRRGTTEHAGQVQPGASEPDPRSDTRRQAAASNFKPSRPLMHFGLLYRRPKLLAVLAGLVLGALILLRSVALPLLPLAALWLLCRPPTIDDRRPKDITTPRSEKPVTNRNRWSVVSGRWSLPLYFVLATYLIVAPWTARNYLAYGGLILVDTTGAENLWLDNNPTASTLADPLGREAAKQALYALGDDRLARQRLAARNGLSAIASNPGWFAQKAWGEATKFFALQYFDDMRERRAIWVPPLEVWLRLLLGDGAWLVLLLGGAIGLWVYKEPRTKNQEPGHIFWFLVLGSRFADPRWLFVPWALYTLLTAMLFHVELRYRLPLYPVLVPYAAWGIVNCKLQIAPQREGKIPIYNIQFTIVGVLVTIVMIISLTLLHRPYLSESWMLTQKHLRLWQAERALGRGDTTGATTAANAALALEGDSALARVALARATLARGDLAGALAALGEAIAALKAHPYAHLLRGAILREQGDSAGAAEEFAYERSSQEDLQRWSWDAFAPFASIPAIIDVGTADLGFVQGFWLPENGARWTRAESQALLRAPSAAAARLTLQMNAGRPASAPSPNVSILVNGQFAVQLAPTNEWRDFAMDIPAALIPPDRRLEVTIRSDTFRPRDYDRASPDDRELGVLIKTIQVEP